MKKLASALCLLALSTTGPAHAKKGIDRPLPNPPLKAGPVLKGLKIHEWGVFLPGEKTTAGGGGEPPAFIQRIQLPPAPPPADEARFREPILHVYAPSSIQHLKVDLLFPCARPELAWPPAEAGWTQGCARTLAVPRLTWDLQVGGEGEAKPPEVPA